MQIRCHVEKYHASFGEFWTNVYQVEAASPLDAVPILDALVAAERPLYASTTMITKARADDMLPNTDQYHTKVYNQAGTRNVTAAGEPLPLFATARVDFTVATGGRPCRKYIRSAIREGDTGGVNLIDTNGLLALLATYAAAVCLQPVTDPQGGDLVSGAAMLPLQMRQLRRGSKKKDTQS